jgi:hypothetical protein
VFLLLDVAASDHSCTPERRPQALQIESFVHSAMRLLTHCGNFHIIFQFFVMLLPKHFDLPADDQATAWKMS